MKNIFGALVVFSFTCYCIIAGEAETPSDGRTKEFPKFKCRYTLPGPNWEWIDLNAPGVVFGARDDTGYVVALYAAPVAPHIALTNEFLIGVEKGATKTGELKKRSSSNLQFKGVPCYQFEATLVKAEKTTAWRIFIANGFSHSLQLIGNEDPAEKSPIFPIAMNNFEFTQKPLLPVAPKSSNSDPKNELEEMGRRVGQVVFYLFLIGLVLYFLQKDKGQKKTA